MPMDIRNFFGAHGAAAAGNNKNKKKIVDATAGASSTTAASSSTSQKVDAIAGVAKKGSISKNVNNKMKKHELSSEKNNKNDDPTVGSSDDDDSSGTDVGQDNNDFVVKKMDQPQKKRKKESLSSDSDGEKEITPEDFFGSSTSKMKKKTTSPRPSPQKKPKVTDSAFASAGSSSKSNNNQKNHDGSSDSDGDDNDDDDDDFDVPVTKKSTPSRASKKRTKNYSIDSESDEDADGSDDDFRMDRNDDEDSGDDDEDFEDTNSKKKRTTKAKQNKNPSPTKKVKASSSPSPSSSSSPAKMKKSPPTPKSATPQATKKTTSARKKSPASATKPTIEVLEPMLEKDSFDTDTEATVPECLAGLTFVFTGLSDDLTRDEASDLVKILGGRVTSAVSGKTTYLVVLGEMLENDKPYTEGSKYIKATGELKDKVKVVMGVKKLYGLCRLYQDRAMRENGITPPPPQPVPSVSAPSKTLAAPSSTQAVSTSGGKATSSPYNRQVPSSTSAPVNPYAKKPINNPYAKPAGQAVVNPYAKPVGNPYTKMASSSNPYASKAGTSNPYAKPSTVGGGVESSSSSKSQDNGLWVDRHKPEHSQQILGNKQNITKLQSWLKNWERTFVNNPKFPHGKAYSNPKGPWKAALLSGPPGIGKTTTATLVSKEDGRDVLEFNASDARSKKTLQQTLGSSIDSQGLSFAAKKPGKGSSSSKKKVIIMDEVDGMGAGDRSGMSELIAMIKKSKVPIICICNDRQSQKLKSLIPHCMDLRFSRPTKNALANRAIRIAQQEGLNVERNAAEAIAESCGNDVRQVLNLLQMWSQKKEGGNSITYKGLKDRESTINKDEILRVSLFDASRTILEGRRDLHNADSKANVSSLMKRTDAFFVDYSFTGLIVQQNYTKVLNGQFLKTKQAGDPNAEYEMLERLHLAAESMSDYNLIESEIRGGDGHWGLLPTAAALAVKCGYHAGGEDGGFLPGYPEFTAWLGKNSSQGKNFRLLNELHHHMNYHVSANSQELRQTYVPVLRDRIFRLLKDYENSAATEEAIQLMDEYGLSREDIAERLEVFALGKPEHKYDDLDSKQKAAFTKAYNAGAHTSQALVSEQGGGSKKKKKSSSSEKDPHDLDAIDDDIHASDDDDDEEEDEKELAKLREKFKKKGRRKSSKTTSKK